ncbi:MAG: TIGR01777 family oxidoreductase [Vicinamibacterales bacterium]
MRIVLAGGSGFLGQALASRLREDGHTVEVLTRHPRAGVATDVGWDPDGSAGDWAAALDGAHAVVNLAGANLAGGRWTDERKRVLLESRLRSTRSLVAAIRTVTHRPALISASAVGYYGPRGAEPVPESDQPGDDFLATLCARWEAAARAAEDVTRVALLRTGLVLDPREGALAKMLLPFRLGVGGRLGPGDQYWPWIHIADWVGLAAWIIREAGAAGPFNLTAPEPVTNTRFTGALGKALHRPTLFPVPAVALRLALGEMSTVLLTGQRAVPEHAMALGYRFRFSDVDTALADLL